MLAALLGAKKTRRNTQWEPVDEDAVGWSYRWKWRADDKGKGDAYWLTPSGNEVRSIPEASRWLESGELPDKTKSAAARARLYPGGREGEDAVEEREERGPRASLLLTPMAAGNVQLVEATLQRQGGAALLHPGVLQRAERNPAVLAVLLKHLPPEGDVRRQCILDAIDANGHSALSLACLDRSVEGTAPDVALPAVRMLLEAGATVDAGGEEGATPLHAAAERGHPGAINALIEVGADIDARTERKATPLHAAARENKVEAVEALITAGAAIGAEDYLKRTPIVLAREKRNREAWERLKAAKDGERPKKARHKRRRRTKSRQKVGEDQAKEEL